MRVTITEAPRQSDSPEDLQVLENIKQYLKGLGVIYEVFETGSDAFKCDICGKGFVSLNAVESHKAMKHPPSLRCQVCKIDVKSQREMDNHVRGKKHRDNLNQLKYKDIKVYESNREVYKIDDDIGNRK
jgi:hypothetical protein